MMLCKLKRPSGAALMVRFMNCRTGPAPCAHGMAGRGSGYQASADAVVEHNWVGRCGTRFLGTGEPSAGRPDREIGPNLATGQMPPSVSRRSGDAGGHELPSRRTWSAVRRFHPDPGFPAPWLTDSKRPFRRKRRRRPGIRLRCCFSSGSTSWRDILLVEGSVFSGNRTATCWTAFRLPGRGCPSAGIRILGGDQQGTGGGDPEGGVAGAPRQPSCTGRPETGSGGDAPPDAAPLSRPCPG